MITPKTHLVARNEASFVGGFLGYLIFHHDSNGGFFQPSGIIGSVIGSVIVLLLWLRFGDKSRA